MTDQILKAEAITTQDPNYVEYHFFDENGVPIHQSRVIDKNKNIIRIYPFSYTEGAGLKLRRVTEIEFIGWHNYSELPRLLKPGARVSLTHKQVGPLMRYLYKELPKFTKLTVIKSGGKTRFTTTSVTFDMRDLQEICREVTREINVFENRRKIAVQNGLADISKKFQRTSAELNKGALSRYLSYYGNFNLSVDDVENLLDLIAHVPIGNVTVTENFIETKNRVNVAYLDNVIEQYEALLKAKNDNEKDWQSFFGEHGWILASAFPYQVVLNGREAYVGGKTIEDKEGRVVDFLFQNGFRDNYALLEIKTHKKQLLKTRPYRAPNAFAQHEDCSGALSQCLDQKNIFLTEMGQKYKILDPKVVLIIGMKSSLSEDQVPAFELMRSNQKNVDIISFDEVLEKIRGLRSILQTK